MTRRYYSCADIYPPRSRAGDITDDEVVGLAAALADAVEQTTKIIRLMADDAGDGRPLTLVETHTTPIHDRGRLLLIWVETVMEGTDAT